MSQSQIVARNTDHPTMTAWVEKAEALCRPDRIFWCDGSDAEKEFLIGEAVRQGVLAVDIEEWKKEVMAQDELFIRLHNDLPMELHFQRELLISRL